MPQVGQPEPRMARPAARPAFCRLSEFSAVATTWDFLLRCRLRQTNATIPSKTLCNKTTKKVSKKSQKLRPTPNSARKPSQMILPLPARSTCQNSSSAALLPDSKLINVPKTTKLTSNTSTNLRFAVANTTPRTAIFHSSSQRANFLDQAALPPDVIVLV